MRKYITHLFDSRGKSINGKVQLGTEEAHHNCHGNPALVGYEQRTTVFVRDNGNEPVEIVRQEDEYDNQIEITAFWSINNEDAEEGVDVCECDACDWDEFEVFIESQYQGYDLEALFGA